MIESLILDIEGRISDQVPDIQTIDENYGQIAKMFESGDDADTYPVVSPAALIDVRDVAWSCLAGAAQQGAVSLTVTLAIDCYDDTHTRQGQRRRIADRLSLAHRLHWALQGFKPADTTPLVRTATRLYALPRGWKAYETTYTCLTLDTRKNATPGEGMADEAAGYRPGNVGG